MLLLVLAQSFLKFHQSRKVLKDTLVIFYPNKRFQFFHTLSLQGCL